MGDSGAAAPQSAESGAATLREGTPLLVDFAGSLSSKTASQGDPVSLVLVNDIHIGGVTVARAGCRIFGAVTLAKRAAAPGKSGQLAIRLDYLQVGARKVKLSASRDKAGPSEVRYSRPYHLKWPMGLLRTGDDVEIAQGAVLTLFVAEDVSLPPAE
jgi:hypothetical protein